jgi:hypothetical protein
LGLHAHMTDEFIIESRTIEAIKVRHAAHGHRYTFIVTEVPPNARALRLGPAQPNAKALLPSAAFATAARAFAEREARKADLID